MKKLLLGLMLAALVAPAFAEDMGQPASGGSTMSTPASGSMAKPAGKKPMRKKKMMKKSTMGGSSTGGSMNQPGGMK